MCPNIEGFDMGSKERRWATVIGTLWVIWWGIVAIFGLFTGPGVALGAIIIGGLGVPLIAWGRRGGSISN